VAQIHNNKAPGHDKLKGSTIKRLQPYLSSLLTKIFNSCLKLCYFPKIWKIGDLVVILKDPQKNHSDISNYRPITLLPEHAKIFEKIVRRKLEENLNPLHSPHQFGFSKGKSSTDALHRLTSKITGSRSKYVATLFFDIKGAFDNLWWPGLIQHLRRRGLQPNLLAPGEELPDGPDTRTHARTHAHTLKLPSKQPTIQCNTKRPIWRRSL
jgi:hypothetical protein